MKQWRKEKYYGDIDFVAMSTTRRLERIGLVLARRQPTLTVVAENINDPHNLSAMLRSCDAVGVVEICLVYYGSQREPDINKTSSASAKKWVGLERFGSIEECYAYLHSEGKKIYTTRMTETAASLYDLDLTEPVALVFGNEHDGVSENAWKHADGNFVIPQVGMIQSLNISVACAVSLYEAFRQRLGAGLYSEPQLPAEKIAGLTKIWAAK